MCFHCYEWHLKALAVLAGTPPPGCQECGVTFGALQAASADGNTRMYVHPKDGLYQVLCPLCSDRYTHKRADLYGDTAFGFAQQLK